MRTTTRFGVWIVVLAGCAGRALDEDRRDRCFALGTVRFDQGDFDGAIAAYSEALREDPGMARALNNRGLARAQKGDLEGAIGDYDAVVAREESSAEAFYNRGVARHRLGRCADAIEDLTRAIRLNARYPKALAARGLCRSGARDREGGRGGPSLGARGGAAGLGRPEGGRGGDREAHAGEVTQRMTMLSAGLEEVSRTARTSPRASFRQATPSQNSIRAGSVRTLAPDEALLGRRVNRFPCRPARIGSQPVPRAHAPRHEASGVTVGLDGAEEGPK